ncbi:helix-turn-helix transcriptional regulator [Oceanirhabdus sp. W0125-5]|uniref:helix-turn-helix transcriptional regulator n=1 Tax=Oceanirhabdus sp. W0125-5 TaxID=2999116 RepID=UPI0022F347A3|nr:helix-turn-helix domain-containing protein [Oceanirhabdus sp. W0125-5]WBW95282.1 helix-turn-helix domain-containing protein [Oceanirhabdus sp. W0125-5]
MYCNLKGLIRGANLTQKNIAEILEISESSFNLKINGKSDFTVEEARKISKIFNKSIDNIFFNDEISKMKISSSINY